MTSQNNTSPLVSVCIPTYNRADRLQRAVKKLLESTYGNLEIIVSDNASSDHTKSVCVELANQNQSIQYFRHPSNQGMTANFEFARSKANGKYFLWHGDDDYLEPDFIRLCVDALEADPSLVLASGLSAFHRGDRVVAHYGDRFQLQSSIGWLRVMKFILMAHDGSIFCGVYRKADVMACKLPNCLGGDHVWLIEVMLEGKGEIIPHSLVYREYGDSTSSTFERLVAALGTASWHARYPWIALPLILANNLAFFSNKYSDRWLPIKLGVWLLVFGTALTKQALLIITPKLPFGQRLYRWFFLNER